MKSIEVDKIELAVDEEEVPLTVEEVMQAAQVAIRRTNKIDYVNKYTRYLTKLLVQEVRSNLKAIDDKFKFCYQFTVDTMLSMVEKDGEFFTKYKLFTALYGNVCTEELEFVARQQIPLPYQIYYAMYPTTRI